MVLVIAALVALVWLVQLIYALRVIRSVPPTDSVPRRELERWPRLTMVVPARDEAGGIEAALASKLACGYPELEIVAVDDRSRDETGAILDRAAASDPRVKVTHLDALPEGWLGKLHAMKKGLEVATGEWVLFSDADVHVEKGTLERLIAHAESESIDFVAVFPKMRHVSLLVDALISALIRMIAFTGRVWSANDDRSHVGMGVGAFNLGRRRVLEESGAIEQLRMEIADDVALGALIKQRGSRTRFFAGRSDVHVVFVDSIASAARSIEKGGGWLGFSLLGPMLVPLAAISFEIGIPVVAIAYGGIAAIFGIAALLIATLAHVLMSRHFGHPIRGALIWPIGYVLNMFLALRSGMKAWKQQGVYWRSTFYPREILEKGRRLMIPSLRVRLD